MASTEKVEVEMGHGFAAIGAIVDHEAIASRIQFQLAGDFLGGGQEVAEDGMLFRRDGGVAGLVWRGDETTVYGGLGGNVAEGEDVVVLIDDVGLGFAVDDPFKDRFGHGPFLPDGQFEELGTEMAGSGTDEVNDFVVEPLAGGPPGAGS